MWRLKVDLVSSLLTYIKMRQTLFEDGRHRDRDLFLRFGLLERRRLGCLRGGLLLRARDDCDSLEGKGFF